MTLQDNTSVDFQDEEDDYATPLAWRIPLILALLALFAGLLSVLFLARPDFPGESSIEAGFARDMAAHHSQATEMAEIVRRNTQDESIYAVASEIVILQQLQIGEIRGWLDIWGLPEEGQDLPMTWMGHPTTGRMPGMASMEQMSRMASLPQDEMETEFLRLMIPHHQSGLEMAEAVLDLTRRPEVRDLALAIIAGQGKEIAFMQDMLTWRGEPRMPDSLTTPDMSNDDGMQHHPSASSGGDINAGQVARKTLQFAPWSLAVFALVWLAFALLSGGREDDGVQSNWMALGVPVVALLLAATIQAGFIVGQVQGYSTYALGAALAGATCAATILGAQDRRAAYLTTAATGVALAALYACLRILDPLEPGAAEGSSFAGIASAVLFLVASGACLVLWLASAEPDLGEEEAAG